MSALCKQSGGSGFLSVFEPCQYHKCFVSAVIGIVPSLGSGGIEKIGKNAIGMG